MTEPGAHVARGEHAATAGFEQERRRAAVQWGDCARAAPVWTNLSRRARYPGAANRFAGRADETEYSRSLDGPLLSGHGVGDFDLAQVTVARHLPDRCVAEHFDVSGLLDPVDQIAGHILIQVVAANQQQDAARVSGQKDSGLTGRVSAAHDDGLGIHGTAAPRQVSRRSRHLFLRIARRRRHPVLRYWAPVAIRRHLAVMGSPPPTRESRNRSRTTSEWPQWGWKMRAKLVGLEGCAVGEFGARQAGRESEIIFDPHAAAGLAAGSGASSTAVRSPSEAP